MAQVLASNASLVGKLTAGFAVSDSVADVVSNLAALETASGSIASIALTDSSPILTLTAAQLAADATVLLKIGGSYSITLSGTASVAQVLGASPTLVGRLTANFPVSDSAAHVAGNIDALEAVSGTIASIALTDGSPVLSLSAAQLVSDATVLLKIGGSYDITLSGTATAAQAADANATLVGKLTAGFAVSDSAGAVSTNLDALQGLATDGQLASIQWTGGAPATLSLAAGTLVSDAGALGKITSGYTIDVTGDTVSVAQANALDPAVTAHWPAAWRFPTAPRT